MVVAQIVVVGDGLTRASDAFVDSVALSWHVIPLRSM
jgi:hypothetical protein